MKKLFFVLLIGMLLLWNVEAFGEENKTAIQPMNPMDDAIEPFEPWGLVGSAGKVGIIAVAKMTPKVAPKIVKYVTMQGGRKMVFTISKDSFCKVDFVKKMMSSRKFVESEKIFKKMTNYDYKKALQQIEPGDWVKVYVNGYVGKEKKALHYFFNKDTGKIHLDRIKWKEEW